MSVEFLDLVKVSSLLLHGEIRVGGRTNSRMDSTGESTTGFLGVS
jgi:hypothetical protein